MERALQEYYVCVGGGGGGGGGGGRGKVGEKKGRFKHMFTGSKPRSCFASAVT